MPKYSTFANELEAKKFIEIKSVDEIGVLGDQGVFADAYYILGKGANTLFKGNYDGVIVKNSILGKRILDPEDIKPLCPHGHFPLSGEKEEEVLIKVGAGEDWEEFVLWTIEQGYLGLENLIDIPGSVGAAPIQNIGAYGVEVADCIISVEGIDLSSGEQKSLSRVDCGFGYRDSIFKRALKEKFLITQVCFKFQKNQDHYKFNLSYRGVRDVMQEQNISESDLTQAKLAEVISSIRANKLPDYKKLGTAGSFFKNPIVSRDKYQKLKQKYPELVCFDVEIPLVFPLVEGGPKMCKLSAGQLIDLCGLKNYRIGNVGTYEKHALVLVNYGGASGEEIWEFAQMIQKKVQEQFGLQLEPEVNIV